MCRWSFGPTSRTGQVVFCQFCKRTSCDAHTHTVHVHTHTHALAQGMLNVNSKECALLLHVLLHEQGRGMQGDLCRIISSMKHYQSGKQQFDCGVFFSHRRLWYIRLLETGLFTLALLSDSSHAFSCHSVLSFYSTFMQTAKLDRNFVLFAFWVCLRLSVMLTTSCVFALILSDHLQLRRASSGMRGWCFGGRYNLINLSRSPR